MKYIDSEKLIAEIERMRKINRKALESDHIVPEVFHGRAQTLNHLFEFIDSLQQEQPVLPDNIDKAAKEYDETESWRYEALPHPRRAAFIEGAEWMAEQMKQEQPDVDLEKFTEKIDNYKARYKYPESVSVKGAMAFMARMFYQYPNTARQWYEKLPKATMD